MRQSSTACGLLLVVLLAGHTQARPAKLSEDLQGASRRLLRAIDQPWGLPVTYNLTRFPDVAAVVGDTVTIHWNRTAGGQFSLWKIPSDDCPANFSSSADGQTQVVSLHQAGVATLKMTEPGVITFASSGPGQCNAGALVNIVVSQGIIIPVDIAEAVNVTAPGPVPAPAPAMELTPKATPRRTSAPTPKKTTQPRG